MISAYKRFLGISFVLASPAFGETIWDVSQKNACTTNATLGTASRCVVWKSEAVHKNPLTGFSSLPPILGQQLSLSYNFTCKRESSPQPLFAEMQIIDARNQNVLSHVRIAPTSSPETRKMTVKMPAGDALRTITVSPSPNSSFYQPCYFEINWAEVTPDLGSLEWYADELIDRLSFSNKIEEALTSALTKPEGWERVEQLYADLNEMSEQKFSSCKRDVRQLARRIKTDPKTQDDISDIRMLSGFDADSIEITADQLEDASFVCSGGSALSLSGKIGNLINERLSLKDAAEKASILSRFNECQNQMSSFCRETIESFKRQTLQPYQTSTRENAENFLSYLSSEMNRIDASQSSLRRRIEGLVHEISK